MSEMNTPKEEATTSRTTLALDRTILANERTYVAWIRTGFAALIAGLAAEKFLLEAIPLWGVHTIAIILIVFSSVAFILAAWRYCNLHVRLKDSDVVMVPPVAVIGLSLILTISSCVALVGVLRIW